VSGSVRRTSPTGVRVEERGDGTVVLRGPLTAVLARLLPFVTLTLMQALNLVVQLHNPGTTQAGGLVLIALFVVMVGLFGTAAVLRTYRWRVELTPAGLLIVGGRARLRRWADVEQVRFESVIGVGVRVGGKVRRLPLDLGSRRRGRARQREVAWNVERWWVDHRGADWQPAAWASSAPAWTQGAPVPAATASATDPFAGPDGREW
jgi:hypothetical protein